MVALGETPSLAQAGSLSPALDLLSECLVSRVLVVEITQEEPALSSVVQECLAAFGHRPQSRSSGLTVLLTCMKPF